MIVNEGFSSILGRCYDWEQRQFVGLALCLNISLLNGDDLYFIVEEADIRLFLPLNERAVEFVRSWEIQQRPVRMMRRMAARPNLAVSTTRCLGSYAPPVVRQLRQRLFQKRHW